MFTSTVSESGEVKSGEREVLGDDDAALLGVDTVSAVAVASAVGVSCAGVLAPGVLAAEEVVAGVGELP
ncbi:hypothetical protein [Rothia endophytica]|uniref:Uncharacterized protein n=1 Tax=Rothia endophytica TaxID=1324766 RepID=A0ABP9B3S2_9MICC